MSASTIDRLLDERTRLVTRNAATEGHLWAAELLLKRLDKLLSEAILPTSALAAHRDVLHEEVREFLIEDREHPGSDVIAADTWPSDGGAEGEAAPPSG